MTSTAARTGRSVAVIGTGRMGAAMAARLAGAGHRVTLFNRTPQRAAEIAAEIGAPVAGTAREAVTEADTVLVSLADDAAVRGTYRGEDGIIAGLSERSLVLDTSTIDPQTVRELAGSVAGRGATLLDTPVSGSVSSVQQGTLTVLAGGPAEAVRRAEPVLSAFAAKVVHVGESGTGSVLKLAVNSLLNGLNQALAEALVLAERAGVARETAYDVFAASAVGAPFLQYKREAFLHPEATPVAFSLELVAKDLRLAADLAARVGARMDQRAVNADVVADALAAGYGERDLSALAELLRR